MLKNVFILPQSRCQILRAFSTAATAAVARPRCSEHPIKQTPANISFEKPLPRNGPRAKQASKTWKVFRPPDQFTKQFGIDLGFILRHGARRFRLPIRPDGYVRVDYVLGLGVFRGLSWEEFRHYVNHDPPRRFQLRKEPEWGEGIGPTWFVRAKQHHTIPYVDGACQRLSNIEKIPELYYCMDRSDWDNISVNGISTKTGVIFLETQADNGLRETRSTVRVVNVELDVRKAFNSGIRFFRTRFSRIVSDGGVTGTISPTFFKEAVEVVVSRFLVKGAKNR